MPVDLRFLTYDLLSVISGHISGFTATLHIPNFRHTKVGMCVPPTTKHWAEKAGRSFSRCHWRINMHWLHQAQKILYSFFVLAKGETVISAIVMTPLHALASSTKFVLQYTKQIYIVWICGTWSVHKNAKQVLEQKLCNFPCGSNAWQSKNSQYLKSSPGRKHVEVLWKINRKTHTP